MKTTATRTAAQAAVFSRPTECVIFRRNADTRKFEYRTGKKWCDDPLQATHYDDWDAALKSLLHKIPPQQGIIQLDCAVFAHLTKWLET